MFNVGDIVKATTIDGKIIVDEVVNVSSNGICELDCGVVIASNNLELAEPCEACGGVVWDEHHWESCGNDYYVPDYMME